MKIFATIPLNIRKGLNDLSRVKMIFATQPARAALKAQYEK
jgi:hypothetical protein